MRYTQGSHPRQVVADESIRERKNVPAKARQAQDHAAAGRTKERWRKTGRPQKNGAKRK
jgi:hypothetical protein